jgi:hypothetical protein
MKKMAAAKLLLLLAVCQGTAAFSSGGGRVLGYGRPLVPLLSRRVERPHLADRQSRWRDGAISRICAQTDSGQAVGGSYW